MATPGRGRRTRATALITMPRAAATPFTPHEQISRMPMCPSEPQALGSAIAAHGGGGRGSEARRGSTRRRRCAASAASARRGGRLHPRRPPRRLHVERATALPAAACAPADLDRAVLSRVVTFSKWAPALLRGCDYAGSSFQHVSTKRSAVVPVCARACMYDGVQSRPVKTARKTAARGSRTLPAHRLQNILSLRPMISRTRSGE